MNNPALKEPSMDEILSSIRQIIADDDAAGAPRRPALQAAPPPMQAAPVRSLGSAAEQELSDMLDDVEPLALSPQQIVADEADQSDAFSFESLLADAENEQEEPQPAAHLVEPEDISFAAEDVASDPEPEPVVTAFAPPAAVEYGRPPEPVQQQPAPAAYAAPAPMAPPASVSPATLPPRQEPRAEVPSPLPDPTLSRDLANQLIEPATQAAVKASMTKLNGIGLGNGGATIESLMRDMLRPMLKEWLDENLPSVVERMVEKEITRIARGD